MNKVILLGRLTKTPEIKYSQANNIKVAIFTLAVNRKYVKQGEEKQTDFVTIVTYSKLADFVEKYLNTGIQICISGQIQTRNWEDKNGQRHYATEVIAEEIDFADSYKQHNENTLYTDATNDIQSMQNIAKETESEVDDLPF